MMDGGDRQPLAIPDLDADADDTVGDAFDDFAPRKGRAGGAAEERRAIDAVSAFPSREAAGDAQMNLKGPKHILDRFKTMCKEDRRPYYAMLEILMDEFERRKD